MLPLTIAARDRDQRQPSAAVHARGGISVQLSIPCRAPPVPHPVGHPVLRSRAQNVILQAEAEHNIIYYALITVLKPQQIYNFTDCGTAAVSLYHSITDMLTIDCCASLAFIPVSLMSSK